MKAVEIIHDPEYGIMIGCIGDDIQSDFKADRIRMANKEYNVLSHCVYNSISDMANLILNVDIEDDEDILLGDVKVIK